MERSGARVARRTGTAHDRPGWAAPVNARRENTVAQRKRARRMAEIAYHGSAGFADPDETTDRFTLQDDYSWGIAPGQYRAQPTVVAERPRMSVSAGIGTVLSVAGACLSATGLLAPEGLVIGLVGVAFCVVGLAAGGEDGVTGRGLAVFGLLCGIAAMAIAVVAFTHRYYWPNSEVDEVAALHDWLVIHWSWLGL
jgi:hypothetical protein